MPLLDTETGCDMMMIVSPRYPAPDWFCDLLGSRKHHGNVKYLISDQLKAAIGHHTGNVITNSQFARRLWAYMSHFPINADEFIPSDRFAAVFGRQKWDDIKMWDDLRSLLSRAEGIKLFLEFHHFACFIQCTYMCRFRKSLYGNSSFTKKSENPLQKVSNLL